MKVAFFLLLCVASSFHQPVEETKHADPFESSKRTLYSIMPIEVVTQFNLEAQKMGMKLLGTMAKPSNIKILLKIIKESNMPNKGRMISTIMRFIAPRNWTPHNFIDVLKNLEPEQVSEFINILLQYFKSLAPQIIGHDFDAVFNYVNEEDAKKVAQLMFELFKEIPEDDLLWIAQRMVEEGKEADRTLKKWTTDEDAVFRDLEETSDQKIRQQTAVNVADLQKIGRISNLSSKIPAIAEAYKDTAINFLDLFLSDLQKQLPDVGPKTIIEGSINASKTFTELASGAMELMEPEQIAEDVEEYLNNLKEMDREKLKNLLEEGKKKIPSVENLKFMFDSSDNLLLKKMDFAKLDETLQQIKNLELPETLINMAADIFLAYCRKLNTHKMREIVEVMAKQSHIDNKLYQSLRTIFFNFIQSQISDFLQIQNLSDDWDNFKKQIKEFIHKIDGKLLTQFYDEFMAEVEHIDPNDASNMAIDEKTIITELLTQDVLNKALESPDSMFDLNEPLFIDFSTLALDAMKLINETQFNKHCNVFVNTLNSDFEKTIKKISTNIKTQFAQLNDGGVAAKTFHIDQIDPIVRFLLDNAQLKKDCADLTTLLKLNKTLKELDRADVINFSWELVKKLKLVLEEGGDNLKSLKMIKDVLDSTVQAIINSGRYNAQDFRAARTKIVAIVKN